MEVNECRRPATTGSSNAQTQLEIGRILFLLGTTLAWLSLCMGCSSSNDESDDSTAESQTQSTRNLRLLVIDDPNLGESAARLWSAQGRGEVELANQTTAEFLQAADRVPKADAILYPSNLLGELIARNAISPISREIVRGDSFSWREITDVDRQVIGNWGDQQFAISLGTQQLILLYRKDLFEQLELSPPQTWAEYLDVSQQLATLPAPDDASAWTPVLEPLAQEWAGKTLMAHAASYVRHPSRFSDLFEIGSLRPLIGDEPYVRAVSELMEGLGTGKERCLNLDANQTTDELLSGNAAMAIGLIHSTPRGESLESPWSNQIGIAQLPGSQETFSFRQKQWEPLESSEPQRVPVIGVNGRLGSVVYLSRRTSTAQDFLLWLAGPEDSTNVLPDSQHTAPSREPHWNQSNRWLDQRLDQDTMAQYVAVAKANLGQSTWFGCLRLPGQHEYARLLDQAVRSVAAESEEAEAALAAAAEGWQTITARYGKQEQVKQYESSLLLE